LSSTFYNQNASNEVRRRFEMIKKTGQHNCVWADKSLKGVVNRGYKIQSLSIIAIDLSEYKLWMSCLLSCLLCCLLCPCLLCLFSF